LELERAVADYGSVTVIPLPLEAADEIEVIPTNSLLPTWAVVVDLYTEEEGRSDLSLEMTLSESSTPLYKVELDDLRVM
jgi:hypothetical protein